ncbi:ankyrin repeat domain-containing protein 26-like [Pollicipes pollicipes]|uniref:ankyrin repeat domain-containing protein 26-like n=1 Tax=Pollicipes pollicipes TaxID=41117 RepID=UPI00188532DA|nr:ankyrin repeat domain-containing protein 26-like [Pollicipes pollicipes]
MLGFDLLEGRERSLSGLQRAVWQGDLERVRSLTAKSAAGLQARDREGRTLLHLAAARGHSQMAELLLGRGLSLDASDNQGCTPLLKAVEADSTATARLLLERGANASHVNHKQANGLHVSVRHGSDRILELLLQHGTNVDQISEDGHTPLHLAILHDRGRTAAELAAAEGFASVQSLIRRLSRRHRSLSQMFSVEELQPEPPADAEHTHQRMDSVSSTGAPSLRHQSSISSAGAPTPRHPSPAAAPDAAKDDSDSWSDDGELMFAPPARKPSVPLPACFLSDGAAERTVSDGDCTSPPASDDSWDDSSSAGGGAGWTPERPGSPRHEEAAPDPPVRQKSVMIRSPAHSSGTSASESGAVSQSQTQCSTSLAGTLGREGTLQGCEELWAQNDTVPASQWPASGPGRRRVSVNLPLLDTEPDWSSSLPSFRRHSVSLDSFLSVRSAPEPAAGAELDADDQLEDMYRPEAQLTPEAVVSPTSDGSSDEDRDDRSVSAGALAAL